jgi:hypothetical protein
MHPLATRDVAITGGSMLNSPRLVVDGRPQSTVVLSRYQMRLSLQPLQGHISGPVRLIFHRELLTRRRSSPASPPIEAADLPGCSIGVYMSTSTWNSQGRYGPEAVICYQNWREWETMLFVGRHSPSVCLYTGGWASTPARFRYGRADPLLPPLPHRCPSGTAAPETGTAPTP